MPSKTGFQTIILDPTQKKHTKWDLVTHLKCKIINTCTCPWNPKFVSIVSILPPLEVKFHAAQLYCLYNWYFISLFNLKSGRGTCKESEWKKWEGPPCLCTGIMYRIVPIEKRCTLENEREWKKETESMCKACQSSNLHCMLFSLVLFWLWLLKFCPFYRRRILQITRQCTSSNVTHAPGNRWWQIISQNSREKFSLSPLLILICELIF